LSNNAARIVTVPSFTHASTSLGWSLASFSTLSMKVRASVGSSTFGCPGGSCASPWVAPAPPLCAGCRSPIGLPLGFGRGGDLPLRFRDRTQV
jgi:hypothetical protein